MKKSSIAAIALACFMALGSTIVFAVPSSQVHRSTTAITVNGGCCPNISNEVVSIREPSTVQAVVLTWSMEFNSTGPFSFGVSLNGGACGDYGPEYIGPSESPAPGATNASVIPNSFRWNKSTAPSLPV